MKAAVLTKILSIFFASCPKSTAYWPDYVGELDVICPMKVIKYGFNESMYGGSNSFPLAVMEEIEKLDDVYHTTRVYAAQWLDYQSQFLFFTRHSKKLYNCMKTLSKRDCNAVDRSCLKFKDFWRVHGFKRKIEKNKAKYSLDESLALCYYFCTLTLSNRKVPMENFRMFCPDPCRENPCRTVEHSKRKCM